MSSSTATIRPSRCGRSATKPVTGTTSARRFPPSARWIRRVRSTGSAAISTRTWIRACTPPSSGWPRAESWAICRGRVRRQSRSGPRRTKARASPPFCANTPTPWATRWAISRNTGRPSTAMTRSWAAASGTGWTRRFGRRRGGSTPRRASPNAFSPMAATGTSSPTTDPSAATVW